MITNESISGRIRMKQRLHWVSMKQKWPWQHSSVECILGSLFKVLPIRTTDTPSLSQWLSQCVPVSQPFPSHQDCSRIGQSHLEPVGYERTFYGVSSEIAPSHPIDGEAKICPGQSDCRTPLWKWGYRKEEEWGGLGGSCQTHKLVSF